MDTNEEMIHRWEEIKCINIIKQYWKWLPMTINCVTKENKWI